MSHGRFKNPVVAALAGVSDFFAKQKLSDRLTDADRADGKICLITGANSGLGFGLAVEMAKRGANVVIAQRRLLAETIQKIKTKSGAENITGIHLDLSKLQSIHEFVDQLKREGIHLDITILNAGVALPKARKTESGQEEMFFVNYLSNVILTNLLLAKGVIVQSGSNSDFLPRILFISSDSHQGSSFIDYDEFGVFKDYGPSKGVANYGYFKLVLNTYAVELSKRINNDGVSVSCNVICPGPVHSGIIKEAPWLLRTILGGIFKIVFKSPAKAAMPVVYMAISPDYEGKTCEYLHMFNPKEMDPKCYMPGEGKKLWDRSIDLWKQIDSNYKVIGY